MKLLSTNVAMLSPYRKIIGQASKIPNFLTSDMWNSIIESNLDLICLNEVKPGSNARLWEDQLKEIHGLSWKIHIPNPTCYVALCVPDRRNQVEIRNDVPQFDRAVTWWVYMDGIPDATTELDFERWSLTIVYAPADPVERRIFFEEELSILLQSLGTRNRLNNDEMNVPSLLTGDFNDYPSFLDVNSRHYDGSRHWQTCLEPAILSTGFHDSFRVRNPDTLQYSFDFVRDGRLVSQRRLDNTLVNDEMESLIDELKYSNEPLCRLFDHSAISITLKFIATNKKGHGQWRLHNNLLISEKYIAGVSQFLKRFHINNRRKTAIHYMLHLLDEVKVYSIQFLTDTREGYRQKALVVNANRIGNNLENSIENGASGIDSDQAIREYTESYKLDIARIEYGRRKRMQNEERMPTAFTREAIFQSKGIRSNIKQLEDPLGAEESSKEGHVMRRYTETFYQILRTPDKAHFNVSFEAESARFLLECENTDGSRTRISSSDKKRLQQDITPEEITDAGKRCNKGSAPGDSGIPYRFWIVFDKPLGKMIAAVAKELMNGFSLPAGEPSIPVKLLHKKGKKSLLSNYRPISLIETYYRLLDIVITTRLGGILAKTIPDTQTAFIPGRNIVMNVLMIFMVLEAARLGMIVEPAPIMLSLDQEKAYDRVRHEWLWAVFRFYNLPDRLLRFFQKFYQNATSKYDINGIYTNAVKLLCGLSQGSPVSTLLYVMILQPYLNCIDNAKIGITVKSSNFGNIMIKQIAFADDIWVFIRDQIGYKTFENISERFAALSNSKFNLSKTRMYEFTSGSDWCVDLRRKFRGLPEEFICLGIPVRTDGNLPVETLKTALGKMTNSVHWNGFNELSLIGRVTVVNTFLTSKMWYCLQIGPVNERTHREMVRFMTTYVFRAKRAWVNFKIVCLPKYMGGLNLLYPEAMTCAMSGAWIVYALAKYSLSGRLFKMVYAEMVLKISNKPPIYCILYPSRGLTRSTTLYTPFFKRVNKVMRTLDFGLQLKLDTYTGDQALSLPWKHDKLYKDYPVIGARGLGDGKAKNVGMTTHTMYAGEFIGWTYRDILFWDLDESRMIVPNKEIAEFLIKCRRYDIYKDDAVKLRELQQAWRMIGKHMEYHILERLPTIFGKRLLKGRRPECCNTIRRTRGGLTYEFTFANYNGFDIEKMIPWHDIKVANEPIEDYQVKNARQFVQTKRLGTKYIHIPNHNVAFPNQSIQKAAWKSQWSELHDNFRTPEHVSILYLVLHNRARLAKDYTVIDRTWENFTLSFQEQGAEDNQGLFEDDVVDEEEADPNYDPDEAEDLEEIRRVSYETIGCCLCEQAKDSVQHSFAECTLVQRFWLDNIQYLIRISDNADSPEAYVSTMQATSRITLRDVLFCFPTWKRCLKRNSSSWKRLLLWHSCCIATLSKIREQAFRIAARDRTKPSYHLEGAGASMQKEYRLCLADIYSEKSRLDSVDPGRTDRPNRSENFFREFVDNSNIARRSENAFQFT